VLPSTPPAAGYVRPGVAGTIVYELATLADVGATRYDVSPVADAPGYLMHIHESSDRPRSWESQPSVLPAWGA
jgi:hypothetical protein